MSDETQENSNGEPVSRTRSPNFPSLNLEEAVKKTRDLFNQARTTAVGIQTVAGVWKYTAKSSSLAKAIAALSAYGLIQTEGSGDSRKVKVSQSGERIVAGAPDAAERLKDAALKPKLFLDICTKYEGRLPTDEVLTNELRWGEDYNFNPESISTFITNLKETIAYAKLDQPATIPTNDGGSGKGGEVQEEGDPPPPPPANTPPAPKGNMKNFAFPMSSGDVVTITAPHPMTEDDFDMLLAIMQAAKRGFLAPKKQSVQAEDPLEDTPSRK